MLCPMLVRQCSAMLYFVTFVIIYFFYFVQDFEALTPNLLARTVETVEGGGLVVLLLRTMSSLKQLYTMAMVCIILYPLITCILDCYQMNLGH